VRVDDSRQRAERYHSAALVRPGHRWPYALIPAYWLLERVPSARDGARRLGLVTLEQMLGAMVGAVEDPCTGVRVVGVPEIRRCTFDSSSAAVTL
jgi:hypothetical protein